MLLLATVHRTVDTVPILFYPSFQLANTPKVGATQLQLCDHNALGQDSENYGLWAKYVPSLVSIKNVLEHRDIHLFTCFL